MQEGRRRPSLRIPVGDTAPPNFRNAVSSRRPSSQEGRRKKGFLATSLKKYRHRYRKTLSDRDTGTIPATWEGHPSCSKEGCDDRDTLLARRVFAIPVADTSFMKTPKCPSDSVERYRYGETSLKLPCTNMTVLAHFSRGALPRAPFVPFCYSGGQSVCPAGHL